MHAHRCAPTLLLGLTAQLASAGGTLGFEEIVPILRENPAIWAQLEAEYLLPESAFGEIRLGPHFKRLSGARTGPYTFLAEKRGQKENLKTQVLVCTDVQFISASGRVLTEPNWEKAVRVRETFRSISFHEQNAWPVCAR